MQTEDKIRDWLMTFPGPVRGHSPQNVIQIALALFATASATKCDLPVFTDNLWRYGFKPEQVGPHWQLALPVKPLADPGHYRRLRNIVR